MKTCILLKQICSQQDLNNGSKTNNTIKYTRQIIIKIAREKVANKINTPKITNATLIDKRIA